ncbi:MAG: glucosaminidase domain-containing protein, partial [Saprospiraceae bacterium]
ALGAQYAPPPATYSIQNAKGADAVAALEALGANTRQSYIETYKDLAITEMSRTGIPASIKLAQGIIESNAGQSELALAANNHFGIKCGGNWTGKTYSKKDDDRDAAGNIVASCFRKYDKSTESFFDHSEFLRDPRKVSRYGFLFSLDLRDYHGWARGLQSAGYATSPSYAENLISVIERHQLYQFDYAGESPIPGMDPVTDRPAGEIPPLERVGRINDVKVVFSKERETLSDIAKLFNIKIQKLVAYNDYGYDPTERLAANERVFLQAKRNRWRGKAAHHTVKGSQTMFEISQLYGVKLVRLYFFNRMENGQEPANGQNLHLKRRRPGTDLVILRDASDAPGKTKGHKLQPAEEELFEIGGDKKAKTDNMAPPPPTKFNPPSGKPATTGVPYPNDPTPPPAASAPPTGANTPPPGAYIPPPPPGAQTSPPLKTASKQPPPAGNFIYHTVVKGDTLFSIARQYNTTVEKIRKLNNLPDNSIQIGQYLKVLPKK